MVSALRLTRINTTTHSSFPPRPAPASATSSLCFQKSSLRGHVQHISHPCHSSHLTPSGLFVLCGRHGSMRKIHTQGLREVGTHGWLWIAESNERRGWVGLWECAEERKSQQFARRVQRQTSSSRLTAHLGPSRTPDTPHVHVSGPTRRSMTTPPRRQESIIYTYCRILRPGLGGCEKTEWGFHAEDQS